MALKEWLLAVLLLTAFAATSATRRYVFNNTPSFTRFIKGSEGFSYRGGHLMVDPITIHLAWFGSWSESSKQALRNAIHSLNAYEAEFPSLYNWWQIVTQYNDSQARHVSGSVTLFRLECEVLAQNVTVETMQQLVSHSCDKLFPLVPQDRSSMYFVLISRSVITSETFYCSGQFINVGGDRRTYSWFRESRGDEFCNMWKRFQGLEGAPNGDTGLDSLISSVLAQAAETASDPEEDGWEDMIQGTVSSKCPSPLGWEDTAGPVMEENGISWNVFGVNGSRYIVQQLWSQESNNCALQIIPSCKGFKVLNDPQGYIRQGLIMNHNVGLQPYKPGLNCTWFVDVPSAKLIRVTLKYMAVGVTDQLIMSSCPLLTLLLSYMFGSTALDRKYCSFSKSLVGSSFEKELPDVAGTFLLVDFIASQQQALPSLGWEIFYQAGYCVQTLVVDKESTGFISDGTPPGQKYLDHNECRWILAAKKGTKVHLKFVHFDTVLHMDVLSVYRGDQLLEVFSGRYIASFPERTYTGPLTLVFSTQTGNGTGWSAYYYMEHPSNPLSSTRALVALILGTASGVFTLAAGAKLLQLWLLRRALSKAARRFSRAELEAATDSFSQDRMIAPELFKGVLTNDQLVAVQRFEGECCEKEYELLCRIKHPNVAAVVGVCYDVRDSFLVFKNMSNGWLPEYLFSDEKCSGLTWERRLRIGTEVAEALGHLHTFAEPCVVHRDVNAKNIFLDSSWNAKLGGFSSALAISTSGTSSAEPKLKAEDVYRMGILILELLTGRCAWDEEGGELTAVARWSAHLIETGGGYVILDRRIPGPLERDRSTMALLKMAEIGAWCMKEKTRERPNMIEVAAVLGQVEAMYFGGPSSPKRRRATSWA